MIEIQKQKQSLTRRTNQKILKITNILKMRKKKKKRNLQ